MGTGSNARASQHARGRSIIQASAVPNACLVLGAWVQKSACGGPDRVLECTRTTTQSPAPHTQHVLLTTHQAATGASASTPPFSPPIRCLRRHRADAQLHNLLYLILPVRRCGQRRHRGDGRGGLSLGAGYHRCRKTASNARGPVRRGCGAPAGAPLGLARQLTSRRTLTSATPTRAHPQPEGIRSHICKHLLLHPALPPILHPPCSGLHGRARTC